MSRQPSCTPADITQASSQQVEMNLPHSALRASVSTSYRLVLSEVCLLAVKERRSCHLWPKLPHMTQASSQQVEMKSPHSTLRESVSTSTYSEVCLLAVKERRSFHLSVNIRQHTWTPHHASHHPFITRFVSKCRNSKGAPLCGRMKCHDRARNHQRPDPLPDGYDTESYQKQQVDEVLGSTINITDRPLKLVINW